ncbi:MAG: hypothetical protein FD189_2124 [Elusimicrobia bacterium]|nr:MAG: hypothetical protein FD154_2181 [Elusimicrobiota bacterium]KAF0154008.1 MAG: hypothetical protein FD189_2124 [Elusimicrobiota bacterium]
MRELFLIADIGGYTRFMRGQAQALAHAQVVVGRLLEALLDSAPPFIVEKLEGDAVFLRLPWPEQEPPPGLFTAVEAMHASFTARQTAMEAARTCNCDSCSQMHALRVKFAAHAGEAARQKIGTFTELAGLDVILVHRMLKNNVPVPEYLLGTQPVLPLLGGAPPALRLDHDFEGVGPTETYYRVLPAARPPNQHAPLPLKLATRGMLEFKGLLYRLGLRTTISIKQS